jgi:pyruvate/2-oxoglutarate dehydrogenase complex dihydrolipoamide dehydrogenase (E3) component
MYQVVRISPEIASVGLTEKQAEKRIRIKIGKFRSLHREKQRLLEHQMVL